MIKNQMFIIIIRTTFDFLLSVYSFERSNLFVTYYCLTCYNLFFIMLIYYHNYIYEKYYIDDLTIENM